MKEFWGLRLFLVMLSIALPHYAFAKDNKELLQSLSKKEGGANTLYIENKGQIGDQNGKPNTLVKYLILRPGLNIQLKANSFSYDAYTIERFKRVERLVEPLHSKFDKQNDDSLVYHFSRVDIELVDANPNPQITQEGASTDYLNYYTHITSQTHGEEGVTGIKGYSTITYHDIYPNIDLEWFLDKDGKPEYQFIINPGGDPSRIRLKYHGAKKTELISDAIHIHIKPGIIKEHIPLSYLKESKEKLTIAFNKTADNEYGFNIPIYASNETLVIDPMPNRLWGTYYGGSAKDYGNAIAIDASKNIYLGGGTSSTTDIATTGAYDVTLGGLTDAFLVKFSSTVFRIWGTYYGGSDFDELRGLSIDASGNVYITGITKSTTAIATTGAHDETFGGSQDVFFTKFLSSGIRSWGTYYGGSNSGIGSGLATDASGNSYLCGFTGSTTDIASTGAYDVTYGGNTDAFLVKFSSSGSRIWGTYYGGNDLEYGSDLATDASGNVYLGGSTSSNTSIASTGAYDVTHGGELDVFLAKFSSSGSREWATYYGGSTDDYGEDIVSDQSGNIYLGGYTTSNSDIASIGAWDVIFGGGDDAFLVKFSSNGSRIWGTYYGGNLNDRGSALSVDSSGNVYLGGYTSSITGISSANTWDSTYNGFDDAFLTKYSSSGTLLWGTYYGGGSIDVAIDLEIDVSGNVYLGGYTSSTTDIASTGAYDVTFNLAYDAFLVKFESSENQISSPTLPYNAFCQNESFTLSNTVAGTFTNPNTFTAQLSDANGSFTNPTPIGTVSSTTSGSINCRIPSAISAGSGYRIRIISSNPSIIGSDNGTNIVINALPQPSISGSTSTCEGSLTYSYTVPSVLGHTYQWTAPSKGTIIGSNTGNTVSIRWTIAGVDSVKIRQTNSQTSCYKDTTIIVSIQSSPYPIISGAVSACQQSQNNSYSIVNIPGHLYQWYAPTRGVITGSGTSNSINVQWTIAGIDSIKVRQTNPQTGCFKDTSMIVTIQALPMPLINGRTSLCATNKDESYSVAFVQGHNYQWFTPSKGKITSTLTSNTLTMQWTISGIDSLKVRQTNPLTGCYKDTMLMVTINELPQSTITGIAKACALSKTSQYSVPLKSNYTYQWGSIIKGNIVGSTKENTVEVFWTSPGIDSVKVRTTNSLTGCFKDTSIIVTIMNNTTPTVSFFGNKNFLCTGDSRGLACDIEADSYQWKRNGEIINGATLRQFIAFKNGSYNVITKLGNCESESQTKDIIEYEKPKPVIEGDRETVLSLLSQTYSVGNANIKRHVWSTSENAMIVDSNFSSIVNVKFLKTGPSIIYIWQESLQGCLGMDSIIVMVKSPSGISTNNQSSSVPYTIYPNPTGDANQIILQFSEAQKQQIDVELLDILGNQMYMSSLNIGDQSTTIPIHNLCAGMYMIRIHMNNEVYMEKVIVN